MSEPVIFSIIQDGQPRHYFDRWGGVLLFRNLVWGSEAVQAWIAEQEEIDEWSDDVAGGIVVDCDRRQLVWCGDDEPLEIPRVGRAFDQLVAAAWPGFEVKYGIRGVVDLAEALGHDDVDDYDDESSQRADELWATLEDYHEGDLDDEADEEERTLTLESFQFPYDEDDKVAWVTLIESGGAVRHRQLPEIPWDLLKMDATAIQILAALPSADIPREAVVREGLWFDQGNQELGFWGSPNSRRDFETLKSNTEWKGRWADGGYGEQCAASGPAGLPMSDAEALGHLVPTLLSTKRIDLQNVVGALGNQLKQTAMKATGCLLIVLSLPVLLFGLISGNMKAAGITIAVMIVIVSVIFKVVEFRMKSKFRKASQREEMDVKAPEAPPVAGPLKSSARKAELDQRLKECGLPSVAECEPYFEEDPDLGELL